MKVADFDYDLPEERIAQQPLGERDASRMLVLGRTSGAVEHRRFRDLADWLRPEDVVVFNDTRVIPARLVGRKATGGAVEILLVERLAEDGDAWSALVRASRPPAVGDSVEIAPGFRARILDRGAELSTLRLEDRDGDVDARLERVGRTPLPPYIHRDPADARGAADRRRYQTVYARSPGAVAAPTAGLHFTRRRIAQLRRRGIGIAHLTVHVGPGTFLPVRGERVEDHRLHSERFRVPEATAAAIGRARRAGGRVVAVGTTVVRALESVATGGGLVASGSGRCDLFIYPGFAFRVVDCLLTNFHLPRSTLLMLVCAFAGRERVLRAYGEAVARGYRFYSYGDAMFVRAES